MAKCGNCKYDSHCGDRLTKTLSTVRSFRNHSSDTGSQPIEVCKNCRCDDCEE